MRLTTCLWTILIAAALANAAAAAGFEKKPYLIYPGTNTEMTVRWQADAAPTNTTLDWGTTTSYGDGPVAGVAGTDNTYSYTLTGLTPGTHYYFRVVVDSENYTGHFYTAPPDTQANLTFYLMGDTRTGVSDYNTVCGQLVTDYSADRATRQTLWLHSGDWVGAGDTESDWTDQFFSTAAPNAEVARLEMPVMGARGNHEETGAVYRKYWPYNYPHASDCYYSFDYGPIHVAVVDQYATYTNPSTQYTWLDNDLAGTTKDWKVVLFHEPAWSAAGGHANNATTQTDLMPLLESHGVQLVVAGHNHYYCRAEANNVIHITAGGGGAPLATPVPTEPNVVAVSESFHFVRCVIDQGVLSATAVDSAGTTVDTWTVSIPGVQVTPTSGLQTSETGSTATFTVVLNTVPTGDVSLTLTSSNTAEGTVSPASLTFTPANAASPQTVTITGVPDGTVDSDVQYTIQTSAATSTDGTYNGMEVADVTVTNVNIDVPPPPPPPYPSGHDGGGCHVGAFFTEHGWKLLVGTAIFLLLALSIVAVRRRRTAAN